MVEFFHPMCSECMQWKERLAGEDRPTAFIDVRERPDLAERYGVTLVPTVLEVDDRGLVVARLAP